jgi:D-beta-D-heptose 7-phosphate kinase/D-beta-D-heptose 1-phosphate adenosyltransferase
MVLTDWRGVSEITRGTPVDVYDVTGAGDTVLAYLAACVANGLDARDAARYANIAAGIKVSRSGTRPVYAGEVDEWIYRNGGGAPGERKILDAASFQSIRKRSPGKKIVFTNGCFDILHIGHIKYLRQAAALGDVLVVGLNSDASVRRLKGQSRPINSQDERACLLSALEFVDYIIVFDEDTPHALISALMPDVLVKGGDYAPDRVVGADVVEQNGGRLVLIPLVDGKSTTAIVEKISS